MRSQPPPPRLNPLVLLCIGFLPFPAALLSRFLTHPGERVAIVVHGGFFLAADANPRTVKRITSRFRLGPPSSLIALGLAFVKETASLLVLLGLALLYLLPNVAEE